MITRANKFLLLLAILMPVGACDKVAEVYTDSFVMNYSIHDGIELMPLSPPTTAQYGVKLKLKEPIKRVGHNSTGADKLLYDQLREKHMDMSYSRKVLLYDGAGGAGAIYPDYTSIKVTSDTDYDTTHPAGTALNDIINCQYQSSYLFVIGAYADESLLKAKTKTLSEVTADDLTMHANLNLFFKKDPAAPGPKNISVSVTTDDGRTFTATCVLTFVFEE